MAALLLVVTVLVTVVGSLLAAASFVRGHRRRAAHHGVAVLTAVAVYTVALTVVGVGSSPRHLALGQVKCFDDWCVTLRSIAAVAGHDDARQVTLVVSSRARRISQRPDNPAAYLMTNASTTPILLPGLDQRLQPGQEVQLHTRITIPAAAHDPRLLVTEGGFPSHLVIGDENSPWHAKATWPL
jgi:hypothetical protein